MQTVTLSLYRFDRWADRLWAFAMMGAARRPLAREPGLSFWKLCGAGTGEGFTPRPNPAVCAILAGWAGPQEARATAADSGVFGRYARRATESWTLHLTPISVRGRWAGETPFVPQPDPGRGPVAALTRATVRPRAARAFWRRVPAISARIGADAQVLFKIGIGEVPLLHQVTFSIWPDTDSMARFARADGPHAEAIRAVRSGDWFDEELYARFRITERHGSWDGGDPLARAEAAA